MPKIIIMNRTLKDYLVIGLKGIAMGAADIIPGVSGGTIAFITGIYEELINSIKSINATNLKLLLKFKLKEFWQAVNGNFLLVLVSGIAFSFLSLAKVMLFLVHNYPIQIWAFFFGLVLASVWYVISQIEKIQWKQMLSFVVGAIVAYFITEQSPAETPNELWFIFLCGAITICVMILPAMSGGFILLLLGKYFYMMEALSTLNLKVIGVFVAGAIIGIISFSNVLSWLLARYRNITLALLGGFMFGSLNKIWPWKQTIEIFIDRHGVERPLIEKNILPHTYEQLTGSSHLVGAIALFLLGVSIVFVVEFIANKLKTK